MKKNFLKVTLVAAFALIAGFNVYNSQKSDVSELALANVEALASGEVSIEYICRGNILGCYDGTYNHFFWGIRQ